MTLLDYLDTLRAKPVHVRKRIAFLTTAAFSLLIFSVWVSSGNIDTELPSTKKVADTPSPWTVAWDSLRNAKDVSVATIKNTTEELQTMVSSNMAATETALLPTPTDTAPQE